MSLDTVFGYVLMGIFIGFFGSSMAYIAGLKHGYKTGYQFGWSAGWYAYKNELEIPMRAEEGGKCTCIDNPSSCPYHAHMYMDDGPGTRNERDKS